VNEESIDIKSLERFRTLRDKRQQLMTLAPRDAMERILQDSQSLALVHSFPEQDFYFLIHDIGPEDAGPLLSLASNRQWEHLVDLETWQKDQIDSQAVSRWLDLLLAADPARFVNWFLNEKLEFVEFFLYQNIEVRVREHDQDPSEFGQGFFTLDDIYYIRFIDQPADGAENELSEAQRKKFITRLADTLSNFDHRLIKECCWKPLMLFRRKPKKTVFVGAMCGWRIRVFCPSMRRLVSTNRSNRRI